MKFVISIETRPVEFDDDWRSAYVWTLHTNSDGPLCSSIGMWETEMETRSAISKAKTTMKGARYAKVEVA